ncbi:MULTISPECIES: hypothetical protein [unclassified Microbacterium]|uniref:hypothetical protein n=1 Tax=unclassified Microbacterium TaxID=2609290 RepID=UPI0004188A4C|nr:hypothetical protein [Microbacterium sp. B24]
MIRTDRAPHTHIAQTTDIVPGCPACRLIRPAVMTRTLYPYLPAVVGPLPSPEGAA